MKYLLVSILCSFSFLAFAQTGDIKGTVFDNTKKEPIEYASVRLLNSNDSSFVKGAMASSKGEFELSSKLGNYILEISFLGYKKYSKNLQLTKESPSHKLGSVYLEENNILLNEMVVTAEVPHISVKNDTIEYNASSFKVGESAVLQDLMKRLPGIEIDVNGNISANGKPISKILVNGKEFFDNNIQLAIKNLPASMINKLQVFKEESEMTKLTGFKDGNEQQVINLTVKEEIKQSIFGDASAGYGTDDRYIARGSVNYMRGESQLSALADINNIGDILNLGLDENKNIGINFNLEKSKKLEFGGSIYYDANQNKLDTENKTQNFLPTGNRISNQNTASKSVQNSLNGSFNIRWKPDSVTSVFFRTSVGHNTSENKRYSDLLSFVNTDTTSGWSDYHTRGNADNINMGLTLGRRLSKKGRRLTLSLNTSLRDDTNAGKNYSITHYSVPGLDSKEIDQRLDIANKSNSWSTTLSYVEPISKSNFLQVAYSYSASNSDRDRNTYKRDNEGLYTVIDTAFTRNTVNNFRNQNLSMSFQAMKEKYNYTIGFNLIPSTSLSRIQIGDSIIENVKQRVINYAPALRFSYRPKETVSLDFDYYGTTNQATLSQLSADTVIVNALNRTYGNPDLKPSFSNNVNVYYQKSNYEKMNFLMISGSFNYILNSIVNYSQIDDVGNTQNTYRNVDGNMGASLGFIYNTPFKKITFSTNTTLNYNRNKGFLNTEDALTNNYIVGEYLSANYTSEKIDFNLKTNISHSITKNSLSTQTDMAVTNYGMSGSITYRLPLDFMLNTDVDYHLNSGYSANFKESGLIWNACIEKQFLKKKQATLRAYFYDILDDRNDVERIVTSSNISYTSSNSISRYFMFSFIYRFSIFKGDKNKDDSF